jgi:hypothetical protein
MHPHSHPWTSLRAAVTLTLVVLLAACVTPATVSPSASSTAEAPIDAEKGGIAFRLTVSGVAVSQYFTFWHQVKLKRIDGPKAGEKYQVAMSDLGALGSATYFGSLPEGRYEVAEFSSAQCGALCLNAKLTLGSNALRFSVEKGKITYLGNLIYQRFNESGARLIASGTKDNSNFRAWLQTYYSATASMPFSDATEETDIAAAQNAYRQAEDAAAGLLNPVIVADGDALFTSLSGNIWRLQSVAGTMTAINTGMGTRVNSVLPISEKRWLAGGDFGALKQTRDAGATWEHVTGWLPYGAVRGLYKGKPDEVIAFVQQKNRLSVYAGNVDQGGAWSEIASSDFKFDRWKGGLYAPLLIPDPRTGRILVALPGAPSFILDTHTYGRSVFEFPGGVMGAGLSGDGVIRCRCNKSGMWVSTWESRDLGKTWQDSSLDRTWPIPEFRDAKLGLITIGFDIHRTEDGGANWKKVLQQDKQYWPFIFQPYSLTYMFMGNQKIVATDTMYELLVSEDAGQSWRRVPKGVRRQ